MTMSDLFGRKRSPFIGFVFAPIAPLLVLSVISIIESGGLPEIIWGAALILPISYLTSLIVGGPLVYILKEWNKNSLWHYLIGGGIASIAPIFIIIFYPLLFLRDPTSANIGWVSAHTSIVLTMFTGGILVAITFWLITRPDKSRIP